MKILAIETSCDETAVAVLECEGDESSATFKVLGNGILSQIDIHKEYGGVYPALAKRAHAKNLVPMLIAALTEAGMATKGVTPLPAQFDDILSREFELRDALRDFLASQATPEIDAIAVTHGPGLEPALWVGVNFAKALSFAWDLPVIGVNHMEGHFLAGLGEERGNTIVLENVQLPALGLLISGGHTELDLMKERGVYECLGATRDDAVGEAFDKVARMMDLPYPGGPEISKLAERAREKGAQNPFDLPRPMLMSGDYDFSFSGLKTAVLYLLKSRGALTNTDKEQLAEAFEDAVADVLWKKSSAALETTGARTLVLGGGVSANKHLGRFFAEHIALEHPGVELRIPSRALTTDNAVMIGIAGYFRALGNEFTDPDTLRADGTLSLTK